MSELSEKRSESMRPLARVMYLGGVAAAGVFSSVMLMASLIISGGNMGEISSPLLFMGYFLAASLLLSLLLLGLFRLLPFRVAKLIAVMIAAYALVSLSLDAVLPMGIGELEEGVESATAAPAWWSLIQVIGTLIVAALIWQLPLILAGNIGWAMVVLITASTILPVMSQVGTEPEERPIARVEANPPPYNVYQVVFDAYYGPWLQWAIEQLDMKADTFAGFRHYPAARANYWATVHSYASFMSGLPYTPGGSISSWRDRADRDSLLTDLKRSGFTTYFAGLGIRPGLAEVDWRDTRRSPALTKAFLGNDFPLIADLWLARAAPVAFRHSLFREGRGWVSSTLGRVTKEPTGDTRSYRSFHQYRRMLEAEEARPSSGAYVHIHVYPPHAPWQLDRTGNFVGESSYDEQILLATNMMKMLVDRLKSLGRFDRSLIIIQSDHGLTLPGRTHKYPRNSDRSFITIDDETADRVGRVNFRGVDGRTLDARYGALLMVKPPSSCKNTKGSELEVEDSLVQLQDIRSYVNSVIEGNAGDCVFPEREFVDIYAGSRRQEGPEGEMQKVGQDLEAGELNVFRIHADGKWEILPNLPFEY
ncbi:MAG: hypothetical protein GVY32_01175 [Gammaproteobacteria bacterium]|jgi:hypothetical protein|nr:hypothetical protein [Gammaproteobacteria bacterium]